MYRTRPLTEREISKASKKITGRDAITWLDIRVILKRNVLAKDNKCSALANLFSNDFADAVNKETLAKLRSSANSISLYVRLKSIFSLVCKIVFLAGNFSLGGCCSLPLVFAELG